MRVIISLLLSASIMFLTTLCAAKEATIDPAVPIIIVNASDLDAAINIDSVAKGLGAPVVLPKDLSERLGLLTPPADNSVATVSALFEKAKNLFFKGEHKNAREIFADFTKQIRTNPAFFAFEPSLRRTAFDALIFAAWSAKELSDTDAMEALFASAAIEFPEMTPAPATFPPWIIEKLSEVKKRDAGELHQVEIDTLDNCEVYLNGRMLAKRTIALPRDTPSAFSLFTRCFGRKSPAILFSRDPALKTVTPLVLAHLEIDYSRDAFALKTQAETPDDQIAVDVAMLAALGHFGRAVVVLSRSQGAEILLVETETAQILRRVSVDASDPGGALEAAEHLSSDPTTSEKGAHWYKDGVAWTLLGSGLAILGTGLVLSQVNEHPSSTEPMAWALAAAGGGIAGTGLVLFFVPRISNGAKVAGSAGLGLAGTWHF